MRAIKLPWRNGLIAEQIKRKILQYWANSRNHTNNMWRKIATTWKLSLNVSCSRPNRTLPNGATMNNVIVSVYRWCYSGVSCVCLCACSPTKAWRRQDGICLGALASRNSNWELVSQFFIFRPIADANCHTLLKLSSLRHWCRVWMVKSAFLRAQMTSTVFPWRYRHRLLVLLRITFSTHSPKTNSKSQMAVNKALMFFTQSY